MKRSAKAPSLTHLEALDDDDNVVAVIETPRGTRAKIAYDDKSEAFKVKKVLPEGMMFPFNFGFIPSTLGGDGDPLDVLVLMDEAAPPGTIVPSRLLGVIDAEQTEKDGKTSQNPRLIAVAEACQLFRDVKKLSDLPNAVVEQMERFFVGYNQEEGKRFEPTGRHGRKWAKQCVETGIRRYRRNNGSS